MTDDLHLPDPSSGKLIGTAPEFDAADTQAAIDAAAAAFPAFKAKTGRERSKLLRKWYDLMVCRLAHTGRDISLTQLAGREQRGYCETHHLGERQAIE